MKLTIDRGALARAAADVARVIPARPSAPVLAGMWLYATDDGLELAAFDYEVSARAQVPASVGDPGEILVSGRGLAAVTADLPDGQVDVTLDGDILRLAATGVRYAMPTMPGADHPAIPKPIGTTGSLDAAEFTAAVGRAAISARDTGKGLYTSLLHIETTPDGITVVATDGLTLAVQHCGWLHAPLDEASLDLPARTLLDTLKGTTGSLDIGIGENLVSIAAADRQTTMTRVAVEYPLWRGIIDQRPANEATVGVDRDDIADALKRCIGVSLAAGDATTIDITEGRVDYSAGGSDLASVAGTIEAETTGEPVGISMNPEYLLDAVKTFPAGHVFLGIAGPRSAVEIAGEGDGVHLIMPIVRPGR